MFNSLVEEMNGGWLDFDERLLARLRPQIETGKAFAVALIENMKHWVRTRLDCFEVATFGKPEGSGARWLGLGR